VYYQPLLMMLQWQSPLFTKCLSIALTMWFKLPHFQWLTLYSENLAKGNIAVTPKKKLCNRSQWAILNWIIRVASLLYRNQLTSKPGLQNSQWTPCAELSTRAHPRQRAPTGRGIEARLSSSYCVITPSDLSWFQSVNLLMIEFISFFASVEGVLARVNT
jgi:hypothetical protein